ncbi:MAG: nitrous oxide reductase accessory protein NosL [Bacteroidota bacterium]
MKPFDLYRLAFLSIAISLGIILIVSCKHEMRELAYGKDNCEHCRMTVIDPQFGAGMMTSTGKVFAFDSGECLIGYIKAKGTKPSEHYYVSDYMKPGTLIDASKAIFLHSDSIQSPMGGNLAAFFDTQEAKATQQKIGGELLSWGKLVGTHEN